jgi:hypothetical protein
MIRWEKRKERECSVQVQAGSAATVEGTKKKRNDVIHTCLDRYVITIVSSIN